MGMQFAGQSGVQTGGMGWAEMRPRWFGLVALNIRFATGRGRSSILQG